MAKAKSVAQSVPPTMAEMVAQAVAAAMAGVVVPVSAGKAATAAKAEKPKIKFLELDIGASVEATIKGGQKVVIGRSKRGLTYVKLA